MLRGDLLPRGGWEGCRVRDSRLVSGVKQTLRLLRAGGAAHVFLAEDAAPSVVAPAAEAARRADVPVTPVPTMRELGRRCGIDVPSACAARRKDPGA